MDDNTTKKSEGLREKILSGIGYVEVDLPAAGKVSIHPYISSGAMEAYESHSNDPQAAFQAMFAESRAEKQSPAAALTAEDADVVARLYAEKEGFLDVYIASTVGGPPFDAFAQAIKGSQLWLDQLETRRQFEATIKRHSRLFQGLTALPRGIEATFKNMNWQIASVPKFAIPAYRIPDLSAFVETRSVALQMTSINARMDLLGIDRISKALAEGVGRWKDLTQNIAKLPDYSAVFRDHTRYLDTLASRAFAAESLLKPHATVFSSFELLAERLRVAEFPSPETLGIARHVFADSESVVRSVSDFFKAPQVPRAPLAKPAIPSSEVRLAFDAEAEVEEAAGESETLLHTTTGRLILVGNDALVGLRGLVGGVIDERLGPIAPILQRLEFLSKANGFYDLLVSFAHHFQRDNWRSLWADVGAAYKARPEEIAQAILAAFLQGHFGDVAFVGRELGNGDGFVDVLVNFLGMDYVVEVKIVGASWGIGSAKDGLTQLDHYVQNYNAASAYLLVFDGRKSEKGEQLAAEYPLKSGRTVRVVVVRSYFDAPSKRK